MVLGMVIVYIFLIILMVLVIISAKVFKRHALATPSPSTSVAKKADEELFAIISAAITAYRKRHKKN